MEKNYQNHDASPRDRAGKTAPPTEGLARPRIEKGKRLPTTLSTHRLPARAKLCFGNGRLAVQGGADAPDPDDQEQGKHEGHQEHDGQRDAGAGSEEVPHAREDGHAALPREGNGSDQTCVLDLTFTPGLYEYVQRTAPVQGPGRTRQATPAELASILSAVHG